MRRLAQADPRRSADRVPVSSPLCVGGTRRGLVGMLHYGEIPTYFSSSRERSMHKGFSSIKKGFEPP